MNSYQRVFKRLAGNEVDHVPNLSIIMTFAASYIGVPYKKYITDYLYLVEGNIECCDEFGIDMVSVISDPCREGADMGAEIRMPEDDVPSFKGILLENYSDLSKIKIIDPLEGPRMLDRIKGVELFNDKVGKKYPILGWVEGPFASAGNLRGINNLMTDLYEKPDFVHELLEICTEQATQFARHQVNAGADFMGIGDAAASLIGPEHYKKFVLPYERKLIQSIQKTGAKTKLHICGNISSFLHLIPRTGVDVVDIDWMLDFSKSVKTLKSKSSACGNFDPVEILLRGSTEKVRNSVKKCLDAGIKDTFISPGCEVPKNTPQENMYEITRTLKKYS